MLFYEVKTLFLVIMFTFMETSMYEEPLCSSFVSPNSQENTGLAFSFLQHLLLYCEVLMYREKLHVD